MATIAECEAAMHQLAHRMGGLGTGDKRRVPLRRSISCHLGDLGVTFAGQLDGGELNDIRRAQSTAAQIRLTLSSDDLLALVAGSLHFARAWASGRLKVEASVLDLVRLRSLL